MFNLQNFLYIKKVCVLFIMKYELPRLHYVRNLVLKVEANDKYINRIVEQHRLIDMDTYSEWTIRMGLEGSIELRRAYIFSEKEVGFKELETWCGGEYKEEESMGN